MYITLNKEDKKVKKNKDRILVALKATVTE